MKKLSHPRLGVDFDGVIADMNTVITEISAKHLGIDLDPTETENYFLRYCYGGISLDMEREIINEALTIESTKKLKPIEGAIEALIEWQEVTGDLIQIVTAREDSKILAPFLEKYMINKMSFTIHYGIRPKGEFCRNLGMTAFLDDFVFNLIDLANHGIVPLIFDQPYNRQANRRFSRLAQRIYSWEHFRSIYIQKA
jgi:hypothetical protein